MNAFANQADRNQCRLVGMNDERRAQPGAWLSRPLCRRYSFAQFGAFRLDACNQGESLDWHWALGISASGECEVLGAWQGESSSVARQIAADLDARGVERIGTVCARPAVAWDAIGPETSKRFAATTVLGEDGADAPGAHRRTRQRRGIRLANDAAKFVQKAVDRAVRQRQRRPNDSDAIAFVSNVLRRADQDLLDAMSGSRRFDSRGAPAFSTTDLQGP
jgi:hypothetical protein